MDYFGIIKKAYSITLKNKFLWILGFLAVGTFSFGQGLFNTPNYIINKADLNNDQIWQKAAEIWANYGSYIIGGLSLALIFCLILFVLSITASGGLIAAVDKMDEGHKFDFKQSFNLGWDRFWKVLGFRIILVVLFTISLLVLIIPTALFYQAKAYPLALIWGLIIIFVDLLFWVIIAVVSPYTLQIIVLENLGIFKSIGKSIKMVIKNFVNVIVIYLLLVAIGIGYGIALSLAILLIAGILTLIGLGFVLASPVLATSYGFVVGTLFLIVIFAVNGAYNAFQSATFTLVYRRIR